MKTIPFSLIAALLFTTSAVAADAIRLDLTRCKFKVEEKQAELFKYDEFESRLAYYTAGAGELTAKIPKEGEYTIHIRASCDPAKGENAKFKVTANGGAVGKETTLTETTEKEYTFTAKLKEGETKVGIEFTNDLYKEGEYDMNFYVHAVVILPKE